MGLGLGQGLVMRPGQKLGLVMGAVLGPELELGLDTWWGLTGGAQNPQGALKSKPPP